VEAPAPPRCAVCDTTSILLVSHTEAWHGRKAFEGKLVSGYMVIGSFRSCVHCM
jgi:hypothetical protein